MGQEVTCKLRLGDRLTQGKALLETDELIFRAGDLRLAIPYKTISRIDAREGILSVTWPDGTASFELGASAVKWADKIRNPPSRIDKLNIHAGQRVLFVGVRDQTLREEIETCGATVLARGTDPVDAIFVAANERGDLERLVTVQKFLKRDGAAGPGSVEWTSKHGSVISSFYNIATVDGMNDAGLVANALFDARVLLLEAIDGVGEGSGIR